MTDEDLAKRAKIELRVEELFRSSLRKEHCFGGKATHIGYEDALALAKQIAVEVSEKGLK